MTASVCNEQREPRLCFGGKTLVQQRTNLIELLRQRFGRGSYPRANLHTRISEIDHTSVDRGVFGVTPRRLVTDTFIHLHPIKVQSSGLFITLWCWEGTASRTSAYAVAARLSCSW